MLPPVIALAIAGGVVGAQRKTLSRLESESAVLRQHIETARNSPKAEREQDRPVRSGKPDKVKDAIDWKDAAESFADMQRTGGVRDMRKIMSFQRKLLAMNKEELVAALETIAALELDDSQRIMLEGMVIGPLVTKDPEFALTRFSSRIDDEQSGMSWQLSNALGEWAGKDPAAAIAWMDREIASGTFDSKSLDGKSRVRTSFEASLVMRLLGTDPSTAGARVAALPANQRKEVFQGFGFQQLKSEDQPAFASLARTHLSDTERLEVFGHQASLLAMRGDLEKVEEYMDGIGATPEERTRSAEDAARSSIEGKSYDRKIKAEEIDSMREWLVTQAPGSVDKVTGESIGGSMQRGSATDFSEAVALVLKYHEQGGGDDVLTGFLDKANTWQDKEEARTLAEKISDPEKRGEALEKLK